jgi:hypothetical protein
MRKHTHITHGAAEGSALVSATNLGLWPDK